MRTICIGSVAAILAVLPALAQTEIKQITFGDKRDVDPMVSPDGNHLAFSSNRTGTFNIFLYTFGESGIAQLTQGKKDDRHPHWLPDNRKIVFSSKRTGNGDLYVTDRQGKEGFLQITDRDHVESFPCVSRSGAISFTTAPDKLVPLRTNEHVAYSATQGAANNAKQLGEGDQARFSPDGKKLVFVSDRTKNKDIWVMNADGSLQTQLTTDAKDDQHPAFSPNGKSIVFTSNRAGNNDIWVMDADGGNPRQLTSGGDDEEQPCWSAGGYIYYVKKQGEFTSNIFRMKAP
ncbi:MAG: hypothetical protein AMXMBFR84_25520 [Candidatus Hydrogenedentota bacterium]